MIGWAGVLLALVLSTAAGWGIIFLLDRDTPRGFLGISGRIALGLILGVGVSSLVAFAVLLLGGSFGPAYPFIDAASMMALTAGCAWLGRRRRSQSAAPPPARTEAAVAGLLIAASALSLVAYLNATAAAPDGLWDAWSIWNNRARFLVRAGAEWRLAFSPALSWSHTEYPLLVPLSVARLWSYAGESFPAPAVLGAAFTLATPMALGSLVARAAGLLPGTVAALLLLATPDHTLSGASQYADLPVAAFLMAGLGTLVALGDDVGAGPGRLALAGLLLGFCGWSKNDGVAAAACALVAFSAARLVRQAKTFARELPYLSAGAALPAAAWILFHVIPVPTVSPEYQDPTGMAGRVLDASRWPFVAWRLLVEYPGRPQGLPAIAIAVAVLLGARPRALARSTPLTAVALLLLVDLLVYVLTPADLAWHLGTSATRVLFQGWPALLLGLFVATGSQPVTSRPGGHPETYERRPA